MRAPAFLVAGWYDFFHDAQIRDFQSYRSSGAGKKAWMLIGPWSHGFFNAHGKDYGIRRRRLEAVPFEFVRESKRWMDYTLKGASAANGPPERRCAYTCSARTRGATRATGRRPERRNAPITRGGTAGWTRRRPRRPTRGQLRVRSRQSRPRRGGKPRRRSLLGPADQSEVEKRRDVLVYSSEPLAAPLLVMGMVKVRLFASSSAVDTDFTAKLVMCSRTGGR